MRVSKPFLNLLTLLTLRASESNELHLLNYTTNEEAFCLNSPKKGQLAECDSGNTYSWAWLVKGVLLSFYFTGP